MTNHFEVSPEQAQLNAVSKEWGEDHTASKYHSALGVVEFDPVTYPEQLIEVSAIPAQRPDGATDLQLLAAGRKSLQNLFGSTAAVDEFIRDFSEPKAGSQLSVATAIDEALKRKENVGMLMCHAWMPDVVVAPVAIALATNSMDYADHTVVILNKPLAWEIHLDPSQKVPITNHIRPYSEQVFVWPNSDKANAYGLEEKTKYSIKRGALEYLLRRLRPKEEKESGTLVGVAPYGSVVRPGTKNGLPSLDFTSRLPDESANICTAMLDKLVAVTIIPDAKTRAMRWKVGELTNVKDIVGDSKRLEAISKVRRFVREQFSSQLGELTGAQIFFKDDEEDDKPLP